MSQLGIELPHEGGRAVHGSIAASDQICRKENFARRFHHAAVLVHRKRDRAIDLPVSLFPLAGGIAPLGPVAMQRRPHQKHEGVVTVMKTTIRISCRTGRDSSVENSNIEAISTRPIPSVSARYSLRRYGAHRMACTMVK